LKNRQIDAANWRSALRPAPNTRRAMASNFEQV